MQMSHDAANYHGALHHQTAFVTTVPFGLIATEMAAWIRIGGGQELWDELYGPVNLNGLLTGNTGA